MSTKPVTSISKPVRFVQKALVLNLGLNLLVGVAVTVGLLALPVAVQAEDALPWQKPWEARGDTRPAANRPPAATSTQMAPAQVAQPNRLGGDTGDDDQRPPYGNNQAGNGQQSGGSPGYGSSPSYGTSPSYGNSGGNAGGNSNGGYNPPAAPGYGQQAQGYGAPTQPGYDAPAAQGGYGAPAQGGYGAPAQGGYGAPAQGGYGAPAQGGYGAPAQGGYGAPAGRGNDAYQAPRSTGGSGDGYGAPYSAPAQQGQGGYEPEPGYGTPPRSGPRHADQQAPSRGGSGYYSQNEITTAGHGFFGSVTRGLASAIEYTFQKAGRPNGYILGEDGGGAFIAGLRYGEGTLSTKDAGQHKVYWQGPSLGYDIGGEGSKTMVLVYNMRDVEELFNRYGGIEGSAYAIGGVSIQFQKYGDVSLALIRSGVGLRLGANVGYLKYSRKPTWNPF
jgi:hypothetical protein